LKAALRILGIVASIIMMVSVMLPYVGGSSLVALVQPLWPQMFQVLSNPSYQNVAITTSVLGMLLIVLGGLIALASFAASFSNRAGLGLDISILGILLISIPVIEFQGSTVMRLITVTGVEYWPNFKFFAIGYFVSWAAAIMGLVAAHERRPERTVIIQQQAAPAAQPVVSREILTGKQAREIKQVESGRLPTGYEALDGVLLGGIPEGASVILTGIGSDERDRIVRRYTETALNSGRGCIYVSTSLERIRDLISPHEKDLQVVLCHPQAEAIAAGFKNVQRLKGLDDLTAINLAFEACKNALISSGSTGSIALCFEVVGDVLLRHHGPMTRKWLMDILARAKSGRMTTLATLNTKMHPADEAHTVIELFDGHIELHEEDVVTPGAKMIRVKKLGGQKFIEKDLLVEKESI
jgi:KaiC/GvpD/RAD55 family RecA-like ATPase